MWLATHTAAGFAASAALKDERKCVKYPVLAVCGYIAHRYMDEIPWVWHYHAFDKLSAPLACLAVAVNAAALVGLSVIDWRRVVEGFLLFDFICDWEWVPVYFGLRKPVLHYAPPFAVGFPHDGMVMEFLLIGVLIAIGTLGVRKSS